MLTPHWIDFVAVGLLAVIAPFNSALRTIPRMNSLDTSTQDKVRSRLYISVIFTQWIFAAAALRAVFMGEISLHDLGLGIPQGSGLLISVGGIVFVLIGLTLQQRSIRRSELGAQVVAESVDKIHWLLPKTRSQHGLWVVVSIHAGVCEELFYRGFLLLLLSNWLPFWAACVVSTLMFGLAHMYQGVKGVVGTAILGAIFLGMYLLTGCLWLSIITHALYDVSVGFLASWALRHERAAITT
ncbi:MAG: CPBP family intramembrane metalloprotease [Planctomycetes bacterium]|nr:CPBP family intramembrane metalloprotease [Planctomycetota bacterium]